MSATAVLAPEQSGRTSAPETPCRTRRGAPPRTRPAGGPGRRPGPSSPSVELPREGGDRLPTGRPVRACSLERPATASAVHREAVAQVRLTDRGIAVILTTGVMIVVAALTVLCLTALRVTGQSVEPLAAYAAQL